MVTPPPSFLGPEHIPPRPSRDSARPNVHGPLPYSHSSTILTRNSRTNCPAAPNEKWAVSVDGGPCATGAALKPYAEAGGWGGGGEQKCIACINREKVKVLWRVWPAAGHARQRGALQGKAAHPPDDLADAEPTVELGPTEGEVRQITNNEPSLGSLGQSRPVLGEGGCLGGPRLRRCGAAFDRAGRGADDAAERLADRRHAVWEREGGLPFLACGSGDDPKDQGRRVTQKLLLTGNKKKEEGSLIKNILLRCQH
eukprot:COSAG01_NODE_96_length_26789_cov_36.697089_15_plen_255_part_00